MSSPMRLPLPAAAQPSTRTITGRPALRSAICCPARVSRRALISALSACSSSDLFFLLIAALLSSPMRASLPALREDSGDLRPRRLSFHNQSMLLYHYPAVSTRGRMPVSLPRPQRSGSLPEGAGAERLKECFSLKLYRQSCLSSCSFRLRRFAANPPPSGREAEHETIRSGVPGEETVRREMLQNKRRRREKQRLQCWDRRYSICLGSTQSFFPVLGIFMSRSKGTSPEKRMGRMRAAATGAMPILRKKWSPHLCCAYSTYITSSVSFDLETKVRHYGVADTAQFIVQCQGIRQSAVIRQNGEDFPTTGSSRGCYHPWKIAEVAL